MQQGTRTPHRGGLGLAGVLVALGSGAATLVLVLPHDGPDGGPALTGSGPAARGAEDQDAALSGATCWDGSTAATTRSCPVPAGATGLRTVFPALDTADCQATAPRVDGKLEVMACRGESAGGDGYVVRYTRWQPGFDRFAWFDAEQGAVSGRWLVDDRFAGREWSSDLPTADGVEHHRWTATYRAWPLSVEVQATTEAGLAAGRAGVRARVPDRVGR